MAKVQLLDDELINKIAAGEVVERPASVVKELVENAIDAGAQQIRVSLKDGGRQLIQVQDDGLGMDADDALLALKRHTTSKLRRAEDLFEVSTMGFRGEALASIASVSRLTLQTRPRDGGEGTRIVMENGSAQILPWQGSLGTSLTVAELFYNVPARKAFLKTAAAEFAACHEYMQALALSMPQLGFTLLHNDKEIFSVGPLPVGESWQRGEATLRQRVTAIFGEELCGPLVYVDKTDRYARIEGLISGPGQDKGSAKHMFTFVNQRWVRDKTLRYGVMRGYHSHLLKGKFPIALLYLSIDPALVDVNVHPAKAELRFQYGNEIQNALAVALRKTLRSSAWAQAPDEVAVKHAVKRETPRQDEELPNNFDLLLGPEAAPMPTGAQHEQVARHELAPAAASRDGTAPVLGKTSADALKGAAAAGDEQAAKVHKTPASDEARDAANSVPAHASQASSGSAQPTPDALGSNDLRKGGTRSLEVGSPRREGGSTGAVKPEALQSSEISSWLASRSERSELSSSGSSRPATTGIKRTTMSFDAPLDRHLRQPSPESPAAGVPSPSRVQTLKSEVAGVEREEVIPWDELHYIGAYARCFLLFECREQMLAIDQHAFHERVLYERLSQNPDLLTQTQPLLMPEVIAFSPGEVVELEQQREVFQKWGLRFQVVSSREIEVTAVPSLLINKDLSSLMHALLSGVRERKELVHDVLATMACHAAVRAGEDLPEPELKALLREAQTVDFYHNCPHGRRVFRWWRQSQVAAWFDRLS